MIKIKKIKNFEEFTFYLNKILDLYISTFGSPERNEVIDRKSLELEMIHSFKDSTFYICFFNEKFVAYSNTSLVINFKDISLLSDYNPNDLYINEIVVSPDVSGQGIGTILLNHIISNSNSNIFLRYRSDYSYLKKFYERNGFKELFKYTTEKNKLILERSILKYSH